MRPYLLAASLVFAASSALADDPTYTLSIKEHRFAPTELNIPAGMRVKLIVKNQDPTPEEFESTDLDIEKVVAAQSDITVYIRPQDAGTYKFFGDFHQDTAQGVLIVK